MTTRIAWCIMLSLSVSAAVAQEPASQSTGAPAPPKKPSSSPASQNAPTISPNLDAYDAVDQGNRLLKSGNAQDALPLYQHAAKLEPDAREIAFAEGLSHYHLGEYDEARTYFDEASLGHTDALADKALYSAGASYHEEALAAAKNDPKTAISKLEDAMQRYQSVLAHNPNYEEARDANYKAGHTWRQIKKLMKQQQQQQQQQNSDKNNKDDQKKQNQKKDQQDQKQEDQDKKNHQQQDQQQKQQDAKRQKQQDQKQQDQKEQQSADQKKQDEKQDQQSASDEQKKEQQSAQKQDEQKDKSQKKQKKLTEQDVSREQAERKLREMMQAQRQREKERAKKIVPLPAQSVDKDW